jgi:ubiquinone/menaquinone biosynthesis C-methylase UbiE
VGQRVESPQVEARPMDPKTANVLYHDAAARTYDAKWAISFDDRCISYVWERAERMLPRARYERVLELGCGTGFFLLNLWQAGFAGEVHACDISPGMVATFLETARTLGCDARARVADAESLPYPDESFDLVVGHAFLHHIPDPWRVLREARRVLRPGGSVFVAGEPTVLGDRMARSVGRFTSRSWRAAARAVPRLRKPHTGEPSSEADRVLRDLEWRVDLHTFDPLGLADMARTAGFREVRVETEELVSSLVGWAVRTIEAEAPPGLLGDRWGRFAYRTYRRLYALDRDVLYRFVPKRLFYNALLYGERRG